MHELSAFEQLGWDIHILIFEWCRVEPNIYFLRPSTAGLDPIRTSTRYPYPTYLWQGDMSVKERDELKLPYSMLLISHRLLEPAQRVMLEYVTLHHPLTLRYFAFATDRTEACKTMIKYLRISVAPIPNLSFYLGEILEKCSGVRHLEFFDMDPGVGEIMSTPTSKAAIAFQKLQLTSFTCSGIVRSNITKLLNESPSGYIKSLRIENFIKLDRDQINIPFPSLKSLTVASAFALGDTVTDIIAESHQLCEIHFGHLCNGLGNYIVPFMEAYGGVITTLTIQGMQPGLSPLNVEEALEYGVALRRLSLGVWDEQKLPYCITAGVLRAIPDQLDDLHLHYLRLPHLNLVMNSLNGSWLPMLRYMHVGVDDDMIKVKEHTVLEMLKATLIAIRDDLFRRKIQHSGINYVL